MLHLYGAIYKVINSICVYEYTENNYHYQLRNRHYYFINIPGWVISCQMNSQVQWRCLLFVVSQHGAKTKTAPTGAICHSTWTRKQLKIERFSRGNALKSSCFKLLHWFT